jgi:hypothetical protein
MGFKERGQGIRSTAFTRENLANRDLRLTGRVWRALIDRGLDDPLSATPHDVEEAVTRVVEDMKTDGCDPALDDATVRRAWENSKSLYRLALKPDHHPLS